MVTDLHKHNQSLISTSFTNWVVYFHIVVVENVHLEMRMLALIAEHNEVILVYGVKVCELCPSSL